MSYRWDTLDLGFYSSTTGKLKGITTIYLTWKERVKINTCMFEHGEVLILVVNHSNIPSWSISFEILRGLFGAKTIS